MQALTMRRSKSNYNAEEQHSNLDALVPKNVTVWDLVFRFTKQNVAFRNRSELTHS